VVSKLSPEEVRRLNAQFMKECHDELLRAGHISKGFRVPRDELIRCFKNKWKQYKISLIRGGA